ncbi:alpha/beta hydrolase family protein [Draconibacterium sediminis]|uniref:alpha/beta hydrolase n=1 Tax=Draconibacterium sediminis TaxID=1544798 RepID=UPI0026EF2719|nr:alpha/beta hydrolase-fold protein [Draconibacterium sediminis]
MKKIILLIFLIHSFLSFGATVDTLSIYSNSMQKDIKNVIVLPDSYESEGDSFRVLYGLHGFGRDCSSLLTNFPIFKDFADENKIIIVFPDAGNSFYIDSPVDSRIMYETYISKELITNIDKEYNTRANKNGRIIFGVSMGGYGAMYLATKTDEIWSTAISLSGTPDLLSVYKLNVDPNNFGLTKLLGSPETYPKNWEECSVLNMLHILKEKKVGLLICCGYDDFLYEINSSFHKDLMTSEIPHVYIEMPGGHSSITYWDEAIKYQFTFIENLLNKDIVSPQ